MEPMRRGVKVARTVRLRSSPVNHAPQPLASATHVSDDIHDVFDLSDRITVLRNGRVVDTVRTAQVTKDEVLAMIILGKRIAEETAEGLARLHWPAR
jgi:ABC-type sugar transport system ATPase subunit